VIEDADAEQLSGFDQPLGDREVLLAGLGVAGGMIVNEHHRGSGSDYRRAEYLPWVDDRGVEAADGDCLATHDLVPRVQEQNEKVLAGLLAELGADDSRYIVRAADFRELLAAVAALRQFGDIHGCLVSGAGKKKGSRVSDQGAPRIGMSE
jgi:hypothetical protein